MKYKEFVKWCNQRACDGCWSMKTAMTCLKIIETIDNFPFWKREKIWRKNYEKFVVNTIIDPINKKILKIINSK